MQFDLVYQIATVVAVLVGSGIGLFRLYWWYQDRKPKFTYERFKEGEIWKLMILHPDKIINKISITMNNQPLPLSNTKNRYERSMRVGEGQNFDVGEHVDDNPDIVIKYDKYRIKKKWKDISLYHYGNF